MSRFTLRLAITLQAAISAGDGLAMIALANRVYQSSHASWAVAAVFLALTVPITTLAPVAGLLLDRLPTRPVLVAGTLATGINRAVTAVDARMPSPQMREKIATLLAARAAAAGQPAPTLAENRPPSTAGGTRCAAGPGQRPAGAAARVPAGAGTPLPGGRG